MKRVWRCIIWVAAGIWLLLCVAVLAIWVASRSPFNSMPVRNHLVGRWFYKLAANSDMGSTYIAIYRDWPAPSVSPPMPRKGSGYDYTAEVNEWWLKQEPYGTYWNEWGFYYQHDTYREINSSGSIVAYGKCVAIDISCWDMALMWLPFFIAGGLIVPRRMMIRRRLKQGLCLVCGYDLRATPQRCPECGTALTAHQKWRVY